MAHRVNQTTTVGTVQEAEKMTDHTVGSSPPADLSDSLIQSVDSLGVPELRALRTYIEQRIDSLQSPLEATIRDDAAGEVREVKTYGSYALVWQHPPGSDGSGVNRGTTLLYHVRREPRPDGTVSLHWAYIGDTSEAEQSHCQACGQTLSDRVATCPHCGSDEIAHPAGWN